MLLAIDIGNSNIEFGIFKGDDILYKFRLGTNREVSSDELGVFICQFFMINGLERKEVQDVIITSVVPQMMYSINNAVRKYFGHVALVIGDNINPEIENKYENSKEVGADRLVNAVSAYDKYKTAVIVVDFGTATTFDAIDDGGAYLGGAIFPGIKISMDALFQKAAKLPRVEIANPGFIIGANTAHSMQAGVFYGYVGAVENIVNKMKEQLGNDINVVATGGLSKLIAQQTNVFTDIDSALTLRGLKIIYDKYKNK